MCCCCWFWSALITPLLLLMLVLLLLPLLQALRLTKGSSGEYRLRMPTALILSQFAFAKMPVTLPLEVFVDGKPVGECGGLV
jgi:hypothetical protein